MNAPAPRTIHAEHLTLVREREPWDVPTRELRNESPEPLQDIPSEDFVLSFMLDNPGRVTSLEASHFTGRDRPLIYQLLRKQPAVSLEELDLLDERLDCPGYINQLRWQGSHVGAKKPVVGEAVAHLRRLGELRTLADAIAQWRREMPTMTPRSARHRLAQLVFPCARQLREAK